MCLKLIIQTFALMMSLGMSGFAAAVGCGTPGAQTITLPAALVYYSDKGSSGMISGTWHEYANAAAYSNCNFAGSKYYLLSRTGLHESRKGYIYDGESYTVFETGAKGIGVIMSVADTDGSWTPIVSASTSVTTWSGFEPGTHGIKFRIRLVAIDNLAEGVISIPAITLISSNYFSNDVYGGGTWVNNTSISVFVKRRSCALSFPQEVTLPKIALSQIPSVGATAGDVSFNISASCSTSNTGYTVSYVVTDVNNTINNSPILTIQYGAGSAKGIALQVLEDSAPIRLSLKRVLGPVGNSGGSLKKNMGVRYIRTAEKATPGQVKSGVTITLSYQ